MKHATFVIRLLSGVLPVALCLASSAPLAAKDAKTGPQAAALVNGKPIPVTQVQELAQDIARSAQASLADVWKDALEQLVTAELLVQEANAKGIKVSEADVDQEIRDLRALGAGHPLAEWANKTPAARLREEVRRSLLVDKLLAREARVQIDPKQVEEYYREHQERFQRPPMVRASHILVKIEGGDRAGAQQRAEELRKRAQQGEDFSALARQFSQDPLTKDKGGDLGFFPEHPTPLAKAAFRLNEGEISEVIETPYGLHVLKVTGKRPAGIAPLEEVFNDIKDMLEEDAQEEREEKLVEELRARSKIEILLDRPPTNGPVSKRP
jgi:peptidyl-prolyl cis-trans isomerase C